MKKKMNKKVIKHLKGDIKTFKHEAKEDKELVKKLSSKKHEKHEKHESKVHEKKEHKAKKRAMKRRVPKAKGKVEKVMHEFKEGALHSGSKKGPVVKSKRQALAIALNEQRRAK